MKLSNISTLLVSLASAKLESLGIARNGARGLLSNDLVCLNPVRSSGTFDSNQVFQYVLLKFFLKL